MTNLLEKLLSEFASQIPPSDNGKNDTIITTNQSIWDRTNFPLIEQCVIKLLVNSEGRRELFHCSIRPALGHLVALLLRSFVNDSDVNLRIKSGKFLCFLTQLDFATESADFVAFILPGIFCACRQILTNALPNLHSLDLIRYASELLVNTLSVSFSEICADRTNVSVGECAKPPKSQDVLNFYRDTNWAITAAERILPQITSLLSHLSSHSVDSIRFESVNILSKIRLQISTDYFGLSLDRISIDIGFLLYHDPMQKTQNLTHRLIEDLQSQKRELFESHTLGKLKKAMKSLERDVKNASDGGVYLDNFINAVQITGQSLLGRLLNLPEFLDKLLSPISRIIVVDCSREMICDSFDHKMKGVTNLPPLKFGLSAKQFAELAATLVVETRTLEMLCNWCFDNFRLNSSVDRRLSIAYFSYFLLDTLQKECHHRNRSGDYFAEDILQMLASMESVLEDEVVDHRIANPMVENSTESSLAQLLLYCLSTLRFRPDDIFSARLRIDVIYELLKWCSSSNFVVKHSAELALSRIAESYGRQQRVSSLLQSHAQQIIFKISMDSRDFSVRPRFPLVFAEMVTKCTSADPLILSKIRSVVDELLLWLDRSDQKRVTVLAKALRAYLNAFHEWFPSLAPPPTKTSKVEEENADLSEEVSGLGEETEQRKKGIGDANYPLVRDVVSILNRTKHFLSSVHLPLLLIVLDILRLSLRFVRNYEDELLPMVHQNWHGLIRLFDVGAGRQMLLLDSQKTVLVKAIEVVLCICQLSGDFVHWKIVHEFIPRAVLLMENLLKESENWGKLYAQTITYKLQCAMLDGLPSILFSAKVAPEHCKPLVDLVAAYARQSKLPQKLREKASTALNAIEEMKTN